ncbi:MAG: putative toxin-antitoxin system toxin component, PIN family [Proteobacteria bacterium]|nr:putative toxin-antitoxin system toxin component, PIN family [Pseudomonadota bacterium]
MIPNNRFVVDTNIIISQLLWPKSLPGEAFRKALSSGILLGSEETLQELTNVLMRKKFDPYLTLGERQQFLRQLSFVVDFIPYVISLAACRDPKDDKFLSLAVSGDAKLLLTGDNDLLVLDPFKEIRILNCSSYSRDLILTILLQRSVIHFSRAEERERRKNMNNPRDRKFG